MALNPGQVTFRSSRLANRRGAVVVLIAAAMVMIFAFAAFSIDLGYITVTKAQLQNAADASAMGSAMDLLYGFGPGATMDSSTVIATADQDAVNVAAANRAADVQSVYCDASRDVQFGLYQWTGSSWSMNWGMTPYNMAQVTLHRDEGGSGGDRSLSLFFAPVMGTKTANVHATATAALLPGVGFSTNSNGSLMAGVLPIALDQDTWNALLAGAGTDNFSFNSSTNSVSAGSDGILEVDLYPSGSNLMPPGNRGTVNIGTTNNATSNLVRQILYGLSASDLAPYGGQLRFDQTLQLSGNPGLSAAIKSALTKIIGQPRAIPIFSSVANPGANAVYTIPKFVGIRVLYVQLTGNNKHVYVQPAPYSDPTVIPGKVTVTVDSILAPVSLVQ